MKSQLTTKQGDSGNTRALDGATYPKSHPIMECVGTVDEARTHTALIRLMIMLEKPPGHERMAETLLWVLNAYFAIGAACSDPELAHPEYHSKMISQEDIDRLEAEQLRLEVETRLPHTFTVSASSVLAAEVDITCTVVRRLERSIVRLKEAVPGFDAAHIIVFVNRLSDYLFMLARTLDRTA